MSEMIESSGVEESHRPDGRFKFSFINYLDICFNFKMKEAKDNKKSSLYLVLVFFNQMWGMCIQISTCFVTTTTH